MFFIKKIILSFLVLIILGINFIFALPKVLAQGFVPAEPGSTLVDTPTAEELQAKQKDSLYFWPNIFIPGMDKIFTEKVEVENKKTGEKHIEYRINGESLAKYIRAIYNYAGVIAGAFAMFMLVYGAWQWLMAAGNASKIAMAKETVSTTLIGLAFLFGSYLLLAQISSNLVNFKALQVKDVSIAEDCSAFTSKEICEDNYCTWLAIAESADQPASGSCVPLPSATSSKRCALEDGNGLVNMVVIGGNIIIDRVSTSDARLVPKAWQALQGIQLGQGESIIIKSAFRSYAKQEQLYNCYKNCTASCNGECNEAAAPSCEPPIPKHMDGKAVDVCYINTVEGIDTCSCNGGSCLDKSYNCLNQDVNRPVAPCTAKLIRGEKLLRQKMADTGFGGTIPSEWWHFYYTGP